MPSEDCWTFSTLSTISRIRAICASSAFTISFIPALRLFAIMLILLIFAEISVSAADVSVIEAFCSWILPCILVALVAIWLLTFLTVADSFERVEASKTRNLYKLSISETFDLATSADSARRFPIFNPAFDSSNTFVKVSRDSFDSISCFSAIFRVLSEKNDVIKIAAFARIRPIVQISTFFNVPAKSIAKSGLKYVKHEIAQIIIHPIEKNTVWVFLIEITWLQTTITAIKHAVLYGRTTDS